MTETSLYSDGRDSQSVVTMTTLSPSELRELDTFRLSRRMSYRVLSSEMDLPEPTITRILREKRPRVHDTTAFVLRDYLEKTVRPALAEAETTR
jgi:hypothetical protein